jgi:hypothetical protein
VEGSAGAPKISAIRKYPPVWAKSQRPTSDARLSKVQGSQMNFNHELTTNVEFGLIACWANCIIHRPFLVIEDELITVEQGPPDILKDLFRRDIWFGKKGEDEFLFIR